MVSTPPVKQAGQVRSQHDLFVPERWNCTATDWFIKGRTTVIMSM